jgi:hypothetical protein
MGRFDDVVYRNDDDMTKREKEEREAHRVAAAAAIVIAVERIKKKERGINVQCARARLMAVHICGERERRNIYSKFLFLRSFNEQ